MEDWTEKYRPNTLDEIVGNDNAISELRKWANSWKNADHKKKAVILSGKPGIGKTSAVIALAKDYGWTLLELNTSDARNASKIKNVATYGALNETFDDHGRFISSRDGGRKLIMLDEADNLYERVEGGKSNIDNNFSDKGGKKAIIDTIKITNQPIVLIVNNYYNLIKGSGEELKSLCKLIKFYNPYPSSVFNLLKKICINEGITINQRLLKNIADRCKGDIRSAVNDLQSICLDKKQIDVQSLDVIGYRDREKDIFNALREIFKTKDIQNIKENLSTLDADPRTVLFWINENLPRQYKDREDLNQGYDALSKADIFLGRTNRRQNYALWSYAYDMMNGGVATAKTHSYPNEKYNFPTWLTEKKNSRNYRNIRNSIIEKISDSCHNSQKKSKDFILNYFIYMFQNNTYFAIKMKNKYDLTETEIKYLLGENCAHRLKDILRSTQINNVKPIQAEEVVSDKKEVKKEKLENIQQSLSDF